jgi:CspA family cold shock protein
MKGTVKWYDNYIGYGFIQGDDGKDVFVHRTGMPWATNLYENDYVQYELGASERGPIAINLKKIKKLIN